MAKYFDWNRLGDIENGRGSLGVEMPVAVYRLMQYTITDELYNMLGTEATEELVRRAGFSAGYSLAVNLLNLTAEFHVFVRELQRTLRNLKIGLLTLEKIDLEKMQFVMTVDEDLDCSGLPVQGDTVCFYDEGFIAGIMQAYTGKIFEVREIDCWATGGRTCRFTVNMVD